MSFYSSLMLVANAEVRTPSAKEMRAVLAKAGLLKEGQMVGPRIFCNLAEDVTRLFDDGQARQQNERFFCPDSAEFRRKIHILGIDVNYVGKGFAVSIHGNGYMYPWHAATLRERVVRTAKLARLRRMMAKEFGGRFVFPKGVPELRERWVDGTMGWMWFRSESF